MNGIDCEFLVENVIFKVTGRDLFNKIGVMRTAPVLGTSYHLLYLIKPRLSILPYPPPIINNIKSINHQHQSSAIKHVDNTPHVRRISHNPQPTTPYRPP
jgi:hypothetical protein